VNRNPDERRSIREQIEDYIKNKQAEVTKYELLEKFSGIAGYTIDQAIALNKNLLLWDRASYLHASKLVINQEAKERIKGILDSSVVMGTISSRELFEMIFYKEPKFISDNGIENYNALFSVLNLLFSDRYEFSRPYVALKGSENMNTRDQVREYLSNFDEISLSDLKTYLEDKKIRVLNFSKLVESVSDEYIRADEDLLLKVGSMNISEETYLEIEKNIGVLMGDKGYLSPRLIEEFLLFPNIGRKWTQYLIVSLVKL
jgi:hypothetical protein